MWALLSLAVGSFGIGMTEFVVMGLLPNIASDLLPSVWASSSADAIAQAGWLITLYALGVVVGAPTIAGAVAKYPRHRVMIGLALALTVFNALTFLAPTFEWVALSRFLAGLPHGAYFGIGALASAFAGRLPAARLALWIAAGVVVPVLLALVATHAHGVGLAWYAAGVVALHAVFGSRRSETGPEAATT